MFYDENGKDPIRVPFPENAGLGRMYSVNITGIPNDHDRYRLFFGNSEEVDRCARRIYGLESMTAPDDRKKLLGRVMPDASSDPGICSQYDRNEGKLRRENDLIYLLHVRGFTKSPSAGITKKQRGTFAGVTEKLGHIASLGANIIELMPAYEISSLMPQREEAPDEPEERINYWGYTTGYYFAPRSVYACSDPCSEFRNMADAIHERHMALVMQFWFSKETPAIFISAVLRHWVRVYGVDGFHLIGGDLAFETLSADPALAGKLMYYESIDENRIVISPEDEIRTSVSVYRDDFQNTVRHFLKGDNDTTVRFFGEMIKRGEKCGHVNYIAGYSGFRLADFVAYEHKHNEANRENNADGPDDNASWNCGAEGKTRRIAVLKLRRKLVLNALLMLFFSQGTPMIFAGDEFLNSQEGNNNPYCQDNAVSWINWNLENTKTGQDVSAFIRFLSSYRKAHGILGGAVPLKLMDYKAFGYPDLSAHGTDAWQPDFSAFSHSVGMLYCNLYAKEQDPAFIYCIYNCHWEDKRFALPSMPGNLSWKVIVDTSRYENECEVRKITGKEKSVLVKARSCMVIETSGRIKITEKKGRTPF
ncbi:MAG: hypothetical protein K6C95_11520 [Lachnospiraceae bacterium]|nr:hypothetical protein [Lachnospiraceae bacterium]